MSKRISRSCGFSSYHSRPALRAKINEQFSETLRYLAGKEARRRVTHTTALKPALWCDGRSTEVPQSLSRLSEEACCEPDSIPAVGMNTVHSARTPLGSRRAVRPVAPSGLPSAPPQPVNPTGIRRNEQA